MGAKKYFTDLDLNQNQIKNVVIEKFQESNSFEASINKKAGRIVFDSVFDANLGEDANGNPLSKNEIKYWDGTNWQSVISRFEGQIVYKGQIKGSDELNFESKIGDLYVFITESINPTLNKRVFPGDMVICNDSYRTVNGFQNHWEIIKGNVVEASETNRGVVKFADTRFSWKHENNDVVKIGNHYQFQLGTEMMGFQELTDTVPTPITPSNMETLKKIIPVARQISKSKVFTQTISMNPIVIDITNTYFGISIGGEEIADFKVYKDGQEIEVEIQKVDKSKYAFTASQTIVDAKIVAHIYNHISE